MNDANIKNVGVIKDRAPVEPGQHRLVLLALYDLTAEQAAQMYDPDADPVVLNHEDLTESNVGCDICAQPYTEMDEVCPGEPPLAELISDVLGDPT